jgi:hypothetical protein
MATVQGTFELGIPGSIPESSTTPPAEFEAYPFVEPLDHAEWLRFLAEAFDDAIAKKNGIPYEVAMAQIAADLNLPKDDSE